MNEDHELKIRMKSLFRISYLRRPRLNTGIVAEFKEALSISRKSKKIK